MSGFKPGERVKITVEYGEVQKEDARWLTGFVGAYRFTVPLDGPGVTVERYAYPEPGSDIPDQPGYVVGRCGHRVAGSEWRSGFRVCERCPYPDTTGARATALDADLLRQAARYLRSPANTVEDQSIRLERLAEAATSLAALLEGSADVGVKNSHIDAIARVLTAGAS